MKTLYCLRDCGDDGCKIGGAGQPNVEQRLLVRVKYALDTLHAGGFGNAVEGEAVACNITYQSAETIRCKQLA